MVDFFSFPCVSITETISSKGKWNWNNSVKKKTSMLLRGFHAESKKMELRVECSSWWYVPNIFTLIKIWKTEGITFIWVLITCTFLSRHGGLPICIWLSKQRLRCKGHPTGLKLEPAKNWTLWYASYSIKLNNSNC